MNVYLPIIDKLVDKKIFSLIRVIFNSFDLLIIGCLFIVVFSLQIICVY